jgi:hypothetical protein
MHKNKRFFCISLFVLASAGLLRSQSCDSLVPTFAIDLSSKADSLWISPATLRNGNCCGTIAPDKCIAFDVQISPAAIGVTVNVYAGPITGAWFVHYNCSGITSLGDTILFPSAGPHILTICRPGNGAYQYGIQSIPDSLTNIPKIEQQNQIRIFPNPASDHVFLESNSASIETYQLKDLSGRVIQSRSFSNSEKIELDQISAGIYFIECRSGEYFVRRKLIKN